MEDDARFAFDSTRYDDGDVEGYRGEVYESEDGEDSADEVDPKKLVRTPSVDDIRWYYRNGPLAPTIVDKPVNDAFKHGYSIDGDDDKQDFVDELVPKYKRANRKARRDGFALLWFRLRDTANEWEPPSNVKELYEIKVLTIDDLTDIKPIGFEEKLSAGNSENFAESEGLPSSSIEELATVEDLVDVRGDSDDDDGLKRLPRADSDQTKLATDQLGGEVFYGHSRYYDTTDNGIVISNRLDDRRFEKPIGYIYDRGIDFDPVLIHPSRVIHVTWREDIDGDVEQDTYGRWEGDAVLRPIIHLLRWLHKANWAVAQKLFRHSSPLHVMSYDEGTDDEYISKAERAVENINAKSSITEPPGFDLRTEQNDGDAEIGDSFDVLFNQICAATEFTRSVLFGTQAGTVNGSETDIKNYFNKVETIRGGRFEDDLREAVNWYAQFDANDYEFDPGLDMEWGPLFKLSALDRAEAMARHVQLVTQATSNFILTPEEARSILDEQWADWTGVDLGDDIETTLEELKIIQSAEGEAELLGLGDQMDGNPRVGQNGGGREQGDLGDSSDPTSN